MVLPSAIFPDRVPRYTLGVNPILVNEVAYGDNHRLNFFPSIHIIHRFGILVPIQQWMMRQPPISEETTLLRMDS